MPKLNKYLLQLVRLEHNLSCINSKQLTLFLYLLVYSSIILLIFDFFTTLFDVSLQYL